MAYNDENETGKKPWVSLDMIARRQSEILKKIEEMKSDLAKIHELNTLTTLSDIAEKTGRDREIIFKELSAVIPVLGSSDGEHFFRLGDVRFYTEKYKKE